MTGNAAVLGDLDYWQQEEDRRRKNEKLKGLTKIFAKAAFGMATTFAVKSTIVSVVTFAGANVIFAAAIGGLAITTFSAARDYREEIKQQEKQGAWTSFKGFFGFVGTNWKRYGSKLALNAGIAGAGASVVEYWDEINAAIPDPVKEKAQAAFSFAGNLLSGIGNIIVPAAHAQEVLPESLPGGEASDSGVALVADDQGQPDVTPVLTPEAKFDALMDGIDTSGWSDKALSDLAFAERGQAWAIQNLAYYSLNTSDIPFDIEMARSFALIAQEQGSSLSTQFLSDIEKVAPLTVASEVVQEPVSAAIVSVDTAPAVSVDVAAEAQIGGTSFDTLMDGVDTSGWSEAAKESLAAAQRGQAWGVQNLAHFALHDPTVPYDLDWARSMAELAQEKGSSLSAQFLADLDAMQGVIEPDRVEIARAVEGGGNVIDLQPQAAAVDVDVVSNGDICRVIPEHQSRMFSVDCANENHTIQDGETLKLHFANGQVEEFQNAYGRPVSVASLVEGDVLNVLMLDPGVNARIFEEPAAGTLRFASLQP